MKKIFFLFQKCSFRHTKQSSKNVADTVLKGRLLLLKALFFSKIFEVFPDFFGYIGKWPDKKAKVTFKIYDVIYWEPNNCNTHIVQDLKK